MTSRKTSQVERGPWERGCAVLRTKPFSLAQIKHLKTIHKKVKANFSQWLILLFDDTFFHLHLWCSTPTRCFQSFNHLATLYCVTRSQREVYLFKISKMVHLVKNAPHLSSKMDSLGYLKSVNNWLSWNNLSNKNKHFISCNTTCNLPKMYDHHRKI